MAIRTPWNPAAELENSRLATWIEPGQLHPYVEFGDRSVRGGDDTFLKYEIGALDIDRLIVSRGVKLRLVKGNRPPDFL